jgi:hypothetical protein
VEQKCQMRGVEQGRKERMRRERMRREMMSDRRKR